MQNSSLQCSMNFNGELGTEECKEDEWCIQCSLGRGQRAQTGLERARRWGPVALEPIGDLEALEAGAFAGELCRVLKLFIILDVCKMRENL